MKKFVWAALVLMTAACAVPPTAVVRPQPPAATWRAVGLVVRGVAGASCSLQDVPGWTAPAFTNADGYLAWLTVTGGLRQTAIRCHAEGFVDYEAPAVLATDHNEDLPSIALTPTHVDPSGIPLAQLAAIRGAMWPRGTVCSPALALPLGNRPGDQTNIIPTPYVDNFDAPTREAIAACLKSAGYTHVVVGGLVDWFAYHGQYIGHDYTTPAAWQGFLDQLQWWWDRGLAPIVFIHQDGATYEQTEAQVTPLFADARAQRLIRIVVMPGWEPTKYEWSSVTWAKYVALGRRLLPHALELIHTVSDVDAPVGTDALYDDNGKPNGDGWARVLAAGLHGWLIQNGPYEAGPTDPAWIWKAKEFAAQFMATGDGATYHGAAWHFAGNAGWPTGSAWGAGIPPCLYNAENTAYEAYWFNRPSDAARASWGDLAVASGACGYLDGGSSPVPVLR